MLPKAKRIEDGAIGQRWIQDQVVGGEDIGIGVLMEQEVAASATSPWNVYEPR